MATSPIKLVAIILILCGIAPSNLAVEYTVGDQLGWRPLVNYYSWVRSKSIKLGDTLVFKYGASQGYSVAEVTQFKFIACNASKAKFFENDGDTSITLNEPGQHYFMADGHCSDQMVFSVLV